MEVEIKAEMLTTKQGGRKEKDMLNLSPEMLSWIIKTHLMKGKINLILNLKRTALLPKWLQTNRRRLDHQLRTLWMNI